VQACSHHAFVHGQNSEGIAKLAASQSLGYQFAHCNPGKVYALVVLHLVSEQVVSHLLEPVRLQQTQGGLVMLHLSCTQYTPSAQLEGKQSLHLSVIAKHMAQSP
jgi:hypothetical protein